MKAGKQPLEFPVSSSINLSGSSISRTMVPQHSGHNRRMRERARVLEAKLLATFSSRMMLKERRKF